LLRRATWTFLHTTASSLPAVPSATEQTALANLLLALPVLYPCPHCRADFVSSVKAAGGEAAVREAVKSRSGAERWLWKRHEEVNRKLGKEGGVGLDKVRERWRDGPADGRCDMAW
jgi:FAD-linked sulfhydryl oxidase